MCWNGTTSRSTASSPCRSARPSSPADDRLTQVLSAFSVFAAGYLARPLGAIAIGYIGDRRGRLDGAHRLDRRHDRRDPGHGAGAGPCQHRRRRADPAHRACASCRAWRSAANSAIANVFMVENAPPGRRALAGAISGAGYAVGIQLASLTALACASLLSPTELQDWGWRIPFWLSLIVATAGFWLRRTLKDLPQPPPANRPRRSPRCSPTTCRWCCASPASPPSPRSASRPPSSTSPNGCRRWPAPRPRTPSRSPRQHAAGHAGVAAVRLVGRLHRPAQPAAGERRARRCWARCRSSC